MKKGLILLLLIASTTAWAQGGFGVKAGLNYGDNGEIEFEDVTNAGSDIMTEKGDSKVGYHFGVFYRADLGPVFLKPELLYTQTKSSYEFQNDEAEYKISKLDLPIMVGIDILGGIAGLLTGLLAGGIFGVAQMARGAHFLSHTLWTAGICWFVAFGLDVLAFPETGPLRVLTHCNAGGLCAAVKYGTALAPIYVGAERGMKFHVFADETRPFLQGSRGKDADNWGPRLGFNWAPGVTIRHRDELDGLIETNARDWSLSRMPVVDRNLLRLVPHVNVLGGCCGTDSRHVAALWTDRASA